MRLLGRSALILMAGVVFGTACHLGDDLPLENSQPAGSYHATRLRFTQTGQATVDALAAGANITIVLNQNGSTTTGSLVIPASLNGGVAETLDLAGTYAVSGNQVVFTHASDTFIRNLGWIFDDASGQLSTTASAGGIQYDVILSK